jgi:outer membrane protein assembly factor BamB
VIVASTDGNIYALSRDNGSRQWVFQSGGSIQTQFIEMADNQIYFGNSEGDLFCIDEKDCQVWKVSIGGKILDWPRYHNGHIFVPSDTGLLRCIDVHTVKDVWVFGADKEIYTTPVIFNNGQVVFGSDDYNIYSLNLWDGTLVWKYKTEFWVRSSPVVFGNAIFGASFYSLISLDAFNGRLRWSFPTYADIVATPWVSDEVVICGSYDCVLYCVLTDNGSEKWSFETEDMIVSSVFVWNECVYLCGYDCKLHCLELRTGKEKWSRTFPNALSTMPLLKDSDLFIGCDDGKLYCLSIST